MRLGHRFSLFGIGSLFFVLSACNLPAEQDPQPFAEGADCAAEEYQVYRWQKVEVLDDLTLPRPFRVIGPDMAVTMDFRPDRLNIAYGKTGRIERIYCG